MESTWQGDPWLPSEKRQGGPSTSIQLPPLRGYPEETPTYEGCSSLNLQAPSFENRLNNHPNLAQPNCQPGGHQSTAYSQYGSHCYQHTLHYSYSTNHEQIYVHTPYSLNIDSTSPMTPHHVPYGGIQNNQAILRETKHDYGNDHSNRNIPCGVHATSSSYPDYAHRTNQIPPTISSVDTTNTDRFKMPPLSSFTSKAEFGGLVLSRFIFLMLMDPANEAVLHWNGTVSPNIEFKIEKKYVLAKLWGTPRNKPDMTPDNMFRSFRLKGKPGEKGKFERNSTETTTYGFTPICFEEMEQMVSKSINEIKRYAEMTPRRLGM